MATIKEIAKACNVSISTVSNILNGKEKARQETKELVLQKAKEMNYVPNYMAKNLKQKNTKTIGIIAEDLTIFHTPAIVDGISACLEKKGYALLIRNTATLSIRIKNTAAWFRAKCRRCLRKEWKVSYMWKAITM